MQIWKEQFLLGITGSMGSGKSTVSKVFEELGCFRVNSDSLSKRYTENDSPILPQLKEIFGEDLVDANGNIDRKKIASIVFEDKSKLKNLTDLIHPRVRQDLLDLLKNQPEGTIVAWEAPLLFEVGADQICHSTLTVFVDENTALERTKARDGLTKEQYEARMRNQMDIKEKIKRSEFIIENNIPLETLKEKCSHILNTILSHKG